MGQKDHESRWELEPTDDCGVVSELEESCTGFPEGLVLAQFKHLGDV
jgi:hypothetical protein